MASLKRKASEFLTQSEEFQLIDRIDTIPSKELGQLEKLFCVAKGNCQSRDDYKQLEEMTSQCIVHAQSLNKHFVEYILRGHQLENVYCQIELEDNNTVKSHELIRRDIGELDKRLKDVKGMIIDSDQKQYLLCRLLSFLANGYTDLTQFDSAKTHLDQCEKKGYLNEISSFGCLGKEHLGYYHYARGRYYREKLTSNEIPHKKERKLAKHHFRESIAYFEQCHHGIGCYDIRLVIAKIQLVRLHLDIRLSYFTCPTFPYKTCTDHALQDATRAFKEAKQMYKQALADRPESKRLRIQVNLSIYKSCLHWSMYKIFDSSDQNLEVVRSFHLDKAVECAQIAQTILQDTGYIDKKMVASYLGHLKNIQRPKPMGPRVRRTTCPSFSTSDMSPDQSRPLTRSSSTVSMATDPERKPVEAAKFSGTATSDAISRESDVT